MAALKPQKPKEVGIYHMVPYFTIIPYSFGSFIGDPMLVILRKTESPAGKEEEKCY